MHNSKLVMNKKRLRQTGMKITEITRVIRFCHSFWLSTAWISARLLIRY